MAHAPPVSIKHFRADLYAASMSYSMLNPSFVTTPHRSRGEWSYVKLDEEYEESVFSVLSET